VPRPLARCVLEFDAPFLGENNSLITPDDSAAPLAFRAIGAFQARPWQFDRGLAQTGGELTVARRGGNDCPPELQPGAKCSLRITFSPSSTKPEKLS
jgi:hypothetical protein